MAKVQADWERLLIASLAGHDAPHLYPSCAAIVRLDREVGTERGCAGGWSECHQVVSHHGSLRVALP